MGVLKVDSLLVPSTSTGFPIRGIPNAEFFDVSRLFTLPSSFIENVLYITGCGAGGGGSGVYASGLQTGGDSGHGGSACFRLPIAAKAGDEIEVIIGDAGAAATGASTYSTRNLHFGGDGGTSIVRNLTARNENRYGPLTTLMTEVQLIGGAGGGGDIDIEYGIDYSYMKQASKLSQQFGITSTWRDIGFFVEGGESGQSRGRYISRFTSGQPSETALRLAGPGEIVLGQEFNNSAGGGTYAQGGPGGCLFSPDGYGTGGRGANSTAHNALPGEPGFIMLEWD